MIEDWHSFGSPFPAPENFEPILEPEYPWSYFEEDRVRPSVAHR